MACADYQLMPPDEARRRSPWNRETGAADLKYPSFFRSPAGAERGIEPAW